VIVCEGVVLFFSPKKSQKAQKRRWFFFCDFCDFLRLNGLVVCGFGFLRDFVASCEILVWVFVFLSHAKARRREGEERIRQGVVLFFCEFLGLMGWVVWMIFLKPLMDTNGR